MSKKQSRGEHFMSTVPELQTCSECQALTVTGLADGMPYRIEPWPATFATELVARQSGLKSFSVAALHLVIFRSASRIKYDLDNVPILIDHRCGQLTGIEQINAAMASDTQRFLSRLNRSANDLTDALITLNETLGARVIDY